VATQTKTTAGKSTDAQAVPDRVLAVAREAGHGLLDTTPSSRRESAS
jgi:hypothetical protein